MLPVHHFHVVFTLPSELRPLALYNRALLFDLLFQSASDALKKLAEDDRRLGAQLGITAVLHTWSRDLGFHPHIHCVVTGGGLGRDGNWVRTRPNFLFPVRVLGKLFRGIFLYRLRRLYADGTLACTGKLSALARAPEFQRLLDKLFRKRWNVYSKKPFGGVQGVHQYLAKYTHRIAISNRRLIGFDDRAVVFYTRGGKTASLGPLAFLARFLSHVLPHGFVRIRHFGLYASGSVNTRLPRARASLLAEHANDSGATPVDETLADKTLAGKTLADTTVARLPADQHGQTPDGPDHAKPYLVATGVDQRRCAACGGVMVRYRLFPDVMGSLALGSPATAWSISATRAPPEAA